MKSQLSAMVAPSEFRRAMGLFATGVAVVTSGHGEDVHAMTANAIASVSLNPPLLLFCVNKDATMAHRIRQHQGFTVNILDESQCALSHYFAGMAVGSLPEVTFHEWAGSSRVGGCSAALGCSLYAMHDGGDHWIAVGRVLSIHQSATKTAPLLFYHGQYHHLAHHLEV